MPLVFVISTICDRRMLVGFWPPTEPTVSQPYDVVRGRRLLDAVSAGAQAGERVIAVGIARGGGDDLILRIE